MASGWGKGDVGSATDRRKSDSGPGSPAEKGLIESVSRTFRKYHKYLLCYGLNILLHFYYLPF